MNDCCQVPSGKASARAARGTWRNRRSARMLNRTTEPAVERNSADAVYSICSPRPAAMAATMAPISSRRHRISLPDIETSSEPLKR